jgi:antirestriction protein ArdC
MTTKTKTRRATRPRRDVEAEVTAKVLEALERGTVPWKQPWSAAGILPTSVSTGRPYRGINAFLLQLEAMDAGYASPYWLTFNQAAERGGTVRKGEKGTLVVFWRFLEVPDDKEPDAKKRIGMLRHYVVFNLEQTDGVTLPPRFDLPTERDDFDPIAAAEAVWDGYEDGPELRHAASDSAAYSPDRDVITLPKRTQFATVWGYYGTLFHEMVHSTGHASRLNRFERNGEPRHFGSERYAREELVAEMGAAFLRATAGCDDDGADQTAAYVKNWMQAIRDDSGLVIKAAAQAQRAVDRVLGVTLGGEEDAA